MKQYNRSLDYVTLAMAKGRAGDTQAAAKLFAKAISAPDAVRAVAILEASNKQAFEATAKAKTSAAAKRIKANEEFDMGEDGDMDDLVGEGEEVESAVEDEEEDEDFDEQFAKVLSSMKKKSRK